MDRKSSKRKLGSRKSSDKYRSISGEKINLPLSIAKVPTKIKIAT